MPETSKQARKPTTARIAQVLSGLYGHPVATKAVTELRDVAYKDDVADATRKFLAPTADRGDGFLILSGPASPGFVARATSMISQAHKLLSPITAAPVLAPATAGDVDGLSFALWPKHPPYSSKNRIQRRLFRRKLTSLVSGWLADVAAQTMQPGAPDDFARALNVIATDPQLAEAIRADAQTALTRLETGAWCPQHCLYHGDLWAGNILVPGQSNLPAFYIIDWAGGAPQGYPFIDLARLLMSLNNGPSFNRAEMTALREVIGCDPQDVTSYLLAALGHIGGDLEHFPVDRFRALVGDIHQFAKTL